MKNKIDISPAYFEGKCPNDGTIIKTSIIGDLKMCPKCNELYTTLKIPVEWMKKYE
ncbi:hypothetical protein LCGC14_0547680 [marine sediment metagenome]|uniref:Uncharacterized protein n=1 Tax=marine sediment metagenome TaxID=412755 RepID=A0A0F9UC89_9ZZZZ